MKGRRFGRWMQLVSAILWGALLWMEYQEYVTYASLDIFSPEMRAQVLGESRFQMIMDGFACLLTLLSFWMGDRPHRFAQGAVFSLFAAGWAALLPAGLVPPEGFERFAWLLILIALLVVTADTWWRYRKGRKEPPAETPKEER